MLGRAAVEALLERDGEVRAFVTDPNAAAELRARGVKVAIGDVSDGSHVGGAALQCFSAVLVAEAAHDPRARSFAAGPDAVLACWARAVAEAEVHRAIWVGGGGAAGANPETAVVETAGRDPVSVAAEIAALDEAAGL